MPANVSRKFVDLIFQATGKWASWDPGHTIQVGDFGKIDRKTGVLDVKGNIYKDRDIYEDDPDIIKLVTDNPPIHATRELAYSVISKNGRDRELNLEPHASVAGLAEASVKGEWSFKGKGGALLVLAHPVNVYIPPGKLLGHLAKFKALQDMTLVTQVFFCPAYSLYMTNGKDDVVSLALLGSFPIPHVPGVSAGGQAGAQWWSSYTSGLFRTGREPNGRDDFTPLFMIREIEKRSRFSFHGAVREGDNLWTDVKVPWDPLDEDGNEGLVEDTIFDT